MDVLGELHQLTRPASIADLQQASSALENHREVIDQECFNNEFLEAHLARRIAKALIELVDIADGFDADHRRHHPYCLGLVHRADQSLLVAHDHLAARCQLRRRGRGRRGYGRCDPMANHRSARPGWCRSCAGESVTQVDQQHSACSATAQLESPSMWRRMVMRSSSSTSRRR